MTRLKEAETYGSKSVGTSLYLGTETLLSFGKNQVVSAETQVVDLIWQSGNHHLEPGGGPHGCPSAIFGSQHSGWPNRASAGLLRSM